MASNSFSSMGLKNYIISGLGKDGFQTPTTLQQRALPPIVAGMDAVIQAPVGKERRAISITSALMKVDPSVKANQAFIVLDSPKLVEEYASAISSYTTDSKITCYPLGSGTVKKQFDSAGAGQVHVLVGSAGTFSVLSSMKALNMEQLKVVVLDNVEDSGPPVDTYLELFGGRSSGQVVVLSASNSQKIVGIAKVVMPSSVVRVSNIDGRFPMQDIKHYKISAQNDEDKIGILSDLTTMISGSLVFCNTNSKADWVTAQLTDLGLDATTLHSDTAQASRPGIAQQYRSGYTLVTSDPSVGGVDTQSLQKSISFEMPADAKDYAIRVGWRGAVINLPTAADANKVKDIEKLYNISLVDLPANAEVIF